jgi:hypothetical protein
MDTGLNLDELFLKVTDNIKNIFEQKFNLRFSDLVVHETERTINNVVYKYRVLDGKYYFKHSTQRIFYYNKNNNNWFEQ